MSRYQPSTMTKALGLQAYDFRNRRSSEGLSEGDDDDDDGSHKSDSSDDSGGPDISSSINIINAKDGGNKDINAVKANAAAAIIIHDDDDDDDSDSSSTKFDESESGPYSEPSYLRNSFETSAMDTVMTGDHVNALLKVYEKEDLPKRWNESAGNADDDGIIPTNPYRPPWLNNSGGGIVGGSNIMGSGSGDELNGSGHSIKSRSAPVVPRVRISRREWGSSLETRDCLHDLEMTTEYNGEQLQGGINTFTSSNGDDNDDDDNDTAEYAEVHVMPMVMPMVEGEGSSLDNQTLNELLWDNDQKDENADDQDQGEEEDRVKYQNMRGASLRDLKDNLTNKANQLGDMLKGSSQPPSINNGSEWTAMTKEDPPVPSSSGNSGTNTSAAGNNNNNKSDGGGGPKLVSRRPIHRQASIDDDDIHEDSSSTYIAQHPAPGIKDDENDSVAPTNLEAFNDGRRPRNRRCTTESESMWTTVGESVGSAFGYNRRTSNESQTTAGSNGTNTTSHTNNGTNTLDGSGSRQPTVDDIMNGVDDRIDEESQTRQGQTTSLTPMSISPKPPGRKKNRSFRSSWMNLEGVQKSFIRRQKSFEPSSRRASMTPFIDEDGTPHNFHNDDDADGMLIRYRPGQRTVKRCIGVLFAIAVTVASSAAIAYSIQNTTMKDGTKQDVYVPISPLEMEGVTLEDAIETIAEHGQYTEDDLFRMATSVDEHCHSEQLSSATGRWECQQICHDHFCCFDVEQGVEEDSVGTYNCRTNENRLCPIFAGCEILVLKDFKGNGGKIEDYQQAVAANHGGGGITTSYNVGEKEEATMIQQASTKEDDLGWQEVRQKYITVYCEESHVLTKAGRKQCQQVCENHFCCFDTSRDGYNCQDDKSMTCDVYEACQVMMVGLFDDANGTEPSTPKSPGVDDLNLVPPDMIGDFLLPALPKENTGSEDFAPDPMGVLGDRAPGYIKSSIEYTAAELHEMKADTKQRCSDYQSPTGRLQCEKICQNHHCCFDSDANPATGEVGCRDDPAKLCDVYEPCKVLSGSLNLLTWLADKKEEEKTPAKVVVVSPDIELEMEGGEYIDAAADTSEKYLETFDGEEYIDIVEEADLVVVEIEATSRPTPKRTPEPMIPRTTTPKPTQDATLPPASIPKTTATEQPVPVETLSPLSPPPTPPPIVAVPPPAMHISPATGKPPPPPPIRCIPEGDDEVHTEIYSDDWNDDRYDRCKRWEKKHSLTISEYWDMQGIDSTMEKNILENMLIMENGKNNAAAAAKEEEEAGEQDIISNDDLDDAILDEDQVLEDGEKDDEVRADSGMDGLATEYESLSDTEYENLSGPMLALDDLDDLIMFEDDAIGIEDDSIEDEDDMVFQVEEDFELGIGV